MHDVTIAPILRYFFFELGRKRKVFAANVTMRQENELPDRNKNEAWLDGVNYGGGIVGTQMLFDGE